MPISRFMLSVVVDDFFNDEIQKFLGKFWIEIGLFCKIFEPRDLRRLAGWVRRRQRVAADAKSHRVVRQRVVQSRRARDAEAQHRGGRRGAEAARAIAATTRWNAKRA